MYVDELDEWLDGVVLAAGHPVLSDDGNEAVAPTWDVEYLTPVGEYASLEGVGSEDIRLRATSTGELLAADQDTGLGGWTTVSEEIVDDNAPPLTVEENDEEDRVGSSTNGNTKASVPGVAGIGRKRAALCDDGTEDEEVLPSTLAFNGQQQRRAWVPSNERLILEEANAIAAGAQVGFKRRKRTERGVEKKVRTARSRGDSEG